MRYAFLGIAGANNEWTDGEIALVVVCCIAYFIVLVIIGTYYKK